MHLNDKKKRDMIQSPQNSHKIIKNNLLSFPITNSLENHTCFLHLRLHRVHRLIRLII